MKIISWSTRGLGDQSKQLALKRLILKTNSDLVLIQETKKEAIEPDIIKAIWSSKDIRWIFVEAYRKFGGLLTMWDESKVTALESLKGGYSPR